MKQKPHTAEEYIKTKVLTATPTQLQLMLYDGAIRFCEQARPAVENKEVEKSYGLISRAEKIVMELCNSMRDEFAPETCANMRRLYIFCYDRLVEANLKKELQPLDEALKVLRHMRQTWLMLMDKERREKAEQADSADQPGDAESQSSEWADQQVGAKINFEG